MEWGDQCCCSVAKSCLTLLWPCGLARQAPLCKGFPRQECWNGLSFPSPGDVSNPGDQTQICIAVRFFTTEPPGKWGYQFWSPFEKPVIFFTIHIYFCFPNKKTKLISIEKLKSPFQINVLNLMSQWATCHLKLVWWRQNWLYANPLTGWKEMIFLNFMLEYC